jgi:hypothetical protein
METDTIKEFLASPDTAACASFLEKINAVSAKIAAGGKVEVDPVVEKATAIINNGKFKEWGPALAKFISIYLGKPIPFYAGKEMAPGSWAWESTFGTVFVVLKPHRDYDRRTVMQIENDRCVDSTGKIYDHACLAPDHVRIATPEEIAIFVGELVQNRMLAKLKAYIKSHGNI